MLSSRYRWVWVVALVGGCVAESRRSDGEVESDGAAGGADAVVLDAGPALDTGPVLDTGPAPDPEMPDSGDPAEPCTISITADGETWTGSIPADTRLGCDAFADVLCDYAVRDGEPEGWTRQRCVDGLLIPRGAITLADFCLLPGFAPLPSVSDIVAEAEALTDGGGLTPADDRAFDASPACERIPATSLWGEAVSFNLTAIPSGDAPPTIDAVTVEGLQAAPLVTLGQIERANQVPGGPLWLEGAGVGRALRDAGTLVAHSETWVFFSASEADLMWGRTPTHVEIDIEGPDRVALTGFERLDAPRSQTGLSHLVGAGRLIGQAAVCLSDFGCPTGARCGIEQGHCVEAE